MSLGRAWVHDLPTKLSCAAAHNFQGIEIFYEDIEWLARSQSGLPDDSSPSSSELLSAVVTIRSLCDERGLQIVSLQPFMQYEGLRDRKEHVKRINKLKLWFRLAKLLRTELIQIPASFLTEEEVTGDLDVIVMDLQEMADLGAKEEPVIRFAYENLCWSTYIDTWQKAYEVVERVGRENFGYCLDTFHIAGGVFADPAAVGGIIPNGPENMKKSLKEMVEKVDVKKVFYLQVVDGERLNEPLVKGHPFYVEGQPARMNWSRQARLFVGEEGAYLPALDVMRAAVEGLGYKGWVSLELFSRSMAMKGEGVPEEHARRAEESWEKIKKAVDRWVI